VLKITVDQAPEKITLKLEGSLSGAWVSELEDAWQASLFDGAGRALYVDLASMYGMDAAGRYLLLLIHERGARMIGSSGRPLDGLVEIFESWRLKMDS